MDNLVIDGYNLAFRVAYALPDLTADDGEDTRVVLGFLKSLGGYLRLVNPGAKLYVAWDSGNGRRRALYPEYKAQRNAKSEPGWLDRIKSILPLVGVNQVTSPGEEADDVVATLIHTVLKGGVVVVTRDADYLQLVSDRVAVASPEAKGVITIYDTEKVTREYGVPPSKLCDYRSFVGDTSDNIKGLSRFPSKLAAALVSQYGSVDGVYASGFPGVTKKQYLLLKEGEATVRLNLKLFPLERSLKLCTVDSALNKEAAIAAVTDLQIDPKTLDPYFKTRQGFLKFGLCVYFCMSSHAEVFVGIEHLQTLFGEEDPVFKRMFEGDSPEETRLQNNMDRLNLFLRRLPNTEADIVYLHYAKGKKQSDIAEIFGFTQAAVSYRLKRARERLEFFLSIPDLSSEQIEHMLAPYFDAHDIAILVGMAETTCQSEVAKRLSLTQGRVRHRFFRAVKQLDALVKLHPELEEPHRLFARIADHGFNLGREVSLPQWRDRSLDRLD